MTLLESLLGIGKMPQPGELWVFDDKAPGPWPLENQTPVKILDVKDGWVRYSWWGPYVRTDQRKKMTAFRYCYKFYRND
jgi:hypothetical protein